MLRADEKPRTCSHTAHGKRKRVRALASSLLSARTHLLMSTRPIRRPQTLRLSLKKSRLRWVRAPPGCPDPNKNGPSDERASRQGASRDRATARRAQPAGGTRISLLTHTRDSFRPMTSSPLDVWVVAFSAVICAMLLSAALTPESLGAQLDATIPSGCAPSPSWVESATVSQQPAGALPSCFQRRSSQAEAVLSITNDRPYAQLTTVKEATLDMAESSFYAPLEAGLSRLLSNLNPAGSPSLFLLRPRRASEHRDRSSTAGSGADGPDRPGPR